MLKLVYKLVILHTLKHNTMTKEQHMIELNNILVELMIQKAFADGFNPAVSDLIIKQINTIRNEIENQSPKGSEGIRHSRNRILEVKTGCEEKCPESNETNYLHFKTIL